MAYLSENPKTMDPMTEQAYQFYEATAPGTDGKEEVINEQKTNRLQNLHWKALEDKKQWMSAFWTLPTVSTWQIIS